VKSIGADSVVPVMGEAMPFGPTEDSAFEYMSVKIVEAGKRGCDAVLSTGTMEILVTETRAEALDLEFFKHVGIDPTEKKYLLIKSRQHFRAAFEPIAKHIVRISGPGVTNPDFSELPYQHIVRPMFPLDKDTPFQLDKLDC